MNNLKTEDLCNLADRATHGLMRAAYFDANEEAVEEIKAGVRLCDLIEAGWNVLSTSPDIEKESISPSVYIVAKGIKERKFLLRPDKLKEIVEEVKKVKEQLEISLTDPKNFPRDKASEYQSFFATLGRLFLAALS